MQKKAIYIRILVIILQNLFRFLFRRNNFFTGKMVMETISVAITDSSNVWLPVSHKHIYERHYVHFQIYNEDRYENINILGTCYFILLNTALGTRQVHNTRMDLIFPTLTVFSKQCKNEERLGHFFFQFHYHKIKHVSFI